MRDSKRTDSIPWAGCVSILPHIFPRSSITHVIYSDNSITDMFTKRCKVEEDQAEYFVSVTLNSVETNDSQSADSDLQPIGTNRDHKKIESTVRWMISVARLKSSTALTSEPGSIGNYNFQKGNGICSHKILDSNRTYCRDLR